MHGPQSLVTQEAFANAGARQKRLGQYLTAPEVARLLAALAGADSAKSILDPMAGNGAMLTACRQYGAHTATYGAIEIDPVAHAACTACTPWANPILGNAFDPMVIVRLARPQWDLVITNPPYVRYQSLARSAREGFHLPSGEEIRRGLIAIIEGALSLDPDDRTDFARLASTYSGLADLAVPSWILCAALCAPGGLLAIVLPESWLSRDYAAVVQYLLLRWFRIRYVVEDSQANWFPEAQIKTNLIIAERVERRPSAFTWADHETYLRLRLSGSARGERGLVDRLVPESPASPERRFVFHAAQWLELATNVRTEMLDAESVPIARVAANLYRVCLRHSALMRLESLITPPNCSEQGTYRLPDILISWLQGKSGTPGFTTLDSLGVSVGQGLRTGANMFFYTSVTSRNRAATTVEWGSSLGRAKARVPSAMALPVLRRQADLPDGYLIRTSCLAGRVLVFDTYALPEDIQKGGPLAMHAYRPMSDELARIVRSAATIAIEGSGKHIPDLSAVAPNRRAGDTDKGIPPRYWYMLPRLAARHRPDILVPRVNNGTPTAYVNDQRAAVVDANFSTMWRTVPTAPDGAALIALINSSWCGAVLEYTAAVMGGGALKVEATHLRRIPIPQFRRSEWRTLSALGRALIRGEGDVLARVDATVASALLGRRATVAEQTELQQFVRTARQRRAIQKKSPPEPTHINEH